MRFLLYSVLLAVTGCASAYRGMTDAERETACAERIRPAGIPTGWFTTGVDVMGRHMSGLLLIKNMEGGETRAVFTSEAGVTFFDFGFTGNDFKVYRIIPQLDRKAVVNLLRKDFSLLLGIPFRNGSYNTMKLNDELYFGVTQKKETAYFITGKDCGTLLRLELSSPRKKKVTISLDGDSRDPDSVVIRHHTFDMVITLKKIEKE